jgi:hypothetical protein
MNGLCGRGGEGEGRNGRSEGGEGGRRERETTKGLQGSARSFGGRGRTSRRCGGLVWCMGGN